MVSVFIKIRNHEDELPAFLTILEHHKLVLVIPWMQNHNVKLDFAKKWLEFTANKCHTTCMKAPTKVYSELPKHLDDSIRISMISAICYHRMTKKTKQKTHHTFAMSLYNIHKASCDSEPDERAMADTVPPEYYKFLLLF